MQNKSWFETRMTLVSNQMFNLVSLEKLDFAYNFAKHQKRIQFAAEMNASVSKFHSNQSIN